MALGAVSLIFVCIVFARVVCRFVRSRREIRTVTCPENYRRALVVIDRSPDGAAYDTVADCSRWHDGRLDCGQRCLGRLG